jgi:hypothetical protein
MSESLGSLAQSARSKQLKSARITLIVIGVLTIVANIAIAAMSDSQVDNEVKKLHGQGMLVDQKAVDAAKRETKLVCVGFAVLGVVFVVLGVFVASFPVPITILALVLYLAGFAITAVLDPTTILQGIIFKVIIIGGLARSIKAALEYERERTSVPQEVLIPDGSP